MVTAPIPVPTSGLSQPGPAHAPAASPQGAILRAAAPEPGTPASTSSELTVSKEAAIYSPPSQSRDTFRPSSGGPQSAQITPAASGVRSNLFADPTRAAAGFAGFAPPLQTGPVSPAQPAETRQSLFRAVTGAFRRTQWGPIPITDQPSVRPEPDLSDPRPEAARASARSAASDDMGLDIPAFLRRQSS